MINIRVIIYYFIMFQNSCHFQKKSLVIIIFCINNFDIIKIEYVMFVRTVLNRIIFLKKYIDAVLLAVPNDKTFDSLDRFNSYHNKNSLLLNMKLITILIFCI